MKSKVLCSLLLSLVVLGLSCVSSRLGEIRSPYGSCKSFQSYTPVHFFDVSRFTGIWYKQEIYYLNDEENIPSRQLACYSHTIAIRNVRPLLLYVFWRHANPSGGQMVSDVRNFTAENGVLPLESIWTELQWSFPTEPYTPMIWVQTDYDNWAIAYECINVKETDQSFSLETMVLYTRDPNYDDQKTWDILRTVIGNYGFSPQNMEKVNHTGCNPPL